MAPNVPRVGDAAAGGVPSLPFQGEAEHRSEARSASAYTRLGAGSLF